MPAGLAEQFWDPAAKTVKLPDLVKSFGELSTFKKAADERLARRPKDAAGYELRLPSDYKLPEGAEFKLDGESELAKQVRALAYDAGVDQVGVEKLLATYADDLRGRTEAQTRAEEEFLAADLARLGGNGKTRVDAATAWLKGIVPADIFEELAPIASMSSVVRAIEAISDKMKAGGMATTTGASETAAKVTQADIDKIMRDPSYRTDLALRQKVADMHKLLYPGVLRGAA